MTTSVMIIEVVVVGDQEDGDDDYTFLRTL